MIAAAVVVNPAVVVPAATVTLAGTVALALLLDKVTRKPPPGATAFSVTVQADVPGVFTDPGAFDRQAPVEGRAIITFELADPSAPLPKDNFDGFVEQSCRKFYSRRLGRPSMPPGLYFRALLMATLSAWAPNAASPGASRTR